MELVVAFSPCSAKPQINTNAPISIAKSFNKRILTLSTRSKATTNTFTPLTHANSSNNSYWMVHMDAPPTYLNSKPQIIDYYVTTLQTILGCESDAQMCIYDASGHSDFGFCCEIDDQAAQELARIPGVLSVKPDNRYSSPDKDYNYSEVELSSFHENLLLFPDGTTKHWLVRTNPPTAGALSKAQAVDYFAQILTQVLGNKKDAEMCIYHVSWASDYGFCCELDEKCAKELTDVPGVIGVHPDTNFDSDDKDYRGLTSNIHTKKIFVTGLSFYTSEKTLRAAFDVFGELTEVKIIMDKISKRSKGYAFIEYTTEEAASTALREMNGKIINGWMITVDVAKKNPPKYGRGRSS